VYNLIPKGQARKMLLRAMQYLTETKLLGKALASHAQQQHGDQESSCSIEKISILAIS